MLKKDVTNSVKEFVLQRLQWIKIINKQICMLIIGDANRNWIEDLTEYNIKQIHLNTQSSTTYSPEEVAENVLHTSYESNTIKTFDRLKEKEFIKNYKIVSSIENLLCMMQEWLATYQPKPYIHRESDYVPVWEWKDVMIAALTDLHIGKTGTKQIEDRLWKIYEDIVKQRPRNLHIFCLWDLVETLVQWGMHSWQIEWMEWNFWFQLIMDVVELFESWLIHISLEVPGHIYFHWLTGNHDRISKDKDDDKQRIGWLIIYELIKRWLSKYANHIFISIHHEYIVPIDVGNIRYILAHWDMARITKRKITDVIWSHWDTTKDYTVVLYWHLHTVNISEIKKATMIGMPWLAWAWFYDSKMLDLHSEPGYVEIIPNESKSVDILIKRLA